MTTSPSASPAKGGDRSSRTAYEAVVECVLEHNKDTRSLFLRLPAEQSLVFTPGQFLSLLLPISEQIRTRAYSIASDPEDGNLLEICFNLVPGGLGSQYLFECKRGEVLRFTGPWGTFVFGQPPQEECVFIADGVGIAPIRPMVKRALSLETGRPIRLLYSARRKEDFLYWAELQTLERHYPQFSFEPLLFEPPAQWRGLAGALVETVERKYICADDERIRHFYICGVGGQVTAIRDLLRQAGYLRRAVQYEKW
ncbi:MAG: ferredoxin--NADP reductase [Candidatus Binatia bacterium]